MTREPAFRNQVAWQINHTSDVLRRGAALRARRKHNLSLVECRTIEVIELLQPARLRDVAVESAADKAQVSRIVTGLVERGLVARRAQAGDVRAARLELTDSGNEMARQLGADGQERDRELRGAVSDAEMAQLLRTLDSVRLAAERIAEEEELRHRSASPGDELTGESADPL